MVKDIFQILLSGEVITIALFIFSLILIITFFKLPKKKKYKSRKLKSKKENFNAKKSKSSRIADEPGKIVVPDSTYDLLMKDKE